MALKRVFVANRGEIAVRVICVCQALGLETVLGVSEADRDSMGARLADRAVCIGPARSCRPTRHARRDSSLGSDDHLTSPPTSRAAP